MYIVKCYPLQVSLFYFKSDILKLIYGIKYKAAIAFIQLSLFRNSRINMLSLVFAIDCWLQSAASLRRWQMQQKNLLRSDKNFISLVSFCFLSNNSLSACPPFFCQWICLFLCTVLSSWTSPGYHRNTAALGWAVADRVTVRLNHLHGVLHCSPPAPGRSA